MLNQRVEELSLPGDVARQAGHHPRQGTVSLPASGEREVMVRHGQQFSGVKAVVYPVLVDHLVVPLLGLAAPQYRDYEVVQYSGEVRVDHVPGGLSDPVSEILGHNLSVSALSHHFTTSVLTLVVSSSNPAMLSFLPARKGRI